MFFFFCFFYISAYDLIIWSNIAILALKSKRKYMKMMSRQLSHTGLVVNKYSRITALAYPD